MTCADPFKLSSHSAILQLSKPDVYLVSYKIKLGRKFTLKGQDPDAKIQAVISSSPVQFIIYSSKGHAHSLDIYAQETIKNAYSNFLSNTNLYFTRVLFSLGSFNLSLC